MLSGESAMGMYPEKALAVLGSVSLRIERQCREEMLRETLELPSISSSLSDAIKEEICFSAVKMGKHPQLQIEFYRSYHTVF